MRYYRRAAVVAIILFWGVAASAVTLRVRPRHHGLYGLTLEATKAKGVGKRRAANILYLVIADNYIDLADLCRLPDGKVITINDRYLRPSFRPSRQTVQMSKAIFDLRDNLPREEAKVAEVSQAQQAEMAILEQRAILAEAKQAVLLREIAEKNATIDRLSRELAASRAIKRPSPAPKLTKTTADSFEFRPFLVILSYHFLALAIVIGVVVLIALALKRRLSRIFHVFVPKRGKDTAFDGEVEYETQVRRFCKTCCASGKSEGQYMILDKNWLNHLKKAHGTARPRPAVDENWIFGSEVK